VGVLVIVDGSGDGDMKRVSGCLRYSVIQVGDYTHHGVVNTQLDYPGLLVSVV
jgi:hypothetical protein